MSRHTVSLLDSKYQCQSQFVSPEELESRDGHDRPGCTPCTACDAVIVGALKACTAEHFMAEAVLWRWMGSSWFGVHDRKWCGPVIGDY